MHNAAVGLLDQLFSLVGTLVRHHVVTPCAYSLGGGVDLVDMMGVQVDHVGTTGCGDVLDGAAALVYFVVVPLKVA